MKQRSAKRFLNNDNYHTIAAVAYSIEIEKSIWKAKSKWYGNGSLQISDCSRSVTLDLDFNSEDEYENSMFKLKQLEKISKQAQKDLKKSRKEIKRKNKNGQ